MKVAWTILLISALTDCLVTAATALTSAMVATGKAEMPNKAVLFLGLLGGIVAAGRTIQQALKTTPETAAALKGDVSIVSTTTTSKTP